MKKFTVLGYTNPLEDTSVPLITIVEINRDVYAIYPDCSLHKVDCNIDNLQSIGEFIKEERTRIIYENQYSYIDANSTIHIGNQDEVLTYVIGDYNKIVDNSLKKEYLKDYIKSEQYKLDTNKNNQTIVHISEDKILNFGKYRFLITKRITNGHGISNRLILQVMIGSNYKTVFKKNLYASYHNLESIKKDIFIKINNFLRFFASTYAEKIRLSQNNQLESLVFQPVN